jgi:subtilisin
MKKRKVVGSAVLSLVMGLSVFASGAVGKEEVSANGQETYRVWVQGPNADMGFVLILAMKVLQQR